MMHQEAQKTMTVTGAYLHMHHASSANLSALHLLMICHTLHCSPDFCSEKSACQRKLLAGVYHVFVPTP